MDGSGWTDSVIAKDRPDAPGELSLGRYKFAAPGLFKTLGTPLIAGRDFTWDDVQHKAQVVIVSEKFAREYWRTPSSALGKQIRGNTKDEWRDVVGVTGDIHQDGVDKPAPASVYWPMFMTQFSGVPDWGVRRNVAFVIRSSRAGSESFINEVRQAVWSVDPDLRMTDIHTLDYYYTKSMARTSFTLVMLALAGGMALLLGIVGLYGVISYSVSQRKHEIGIRMALGAQKCDVLRLVAGQGLILALLGVGIGIVLALGLTRFLAGLLYGVKLSDPLTFAAVSALLITVALVASYIPARQSAQRDPVMALRHE